MFATKLIPCFRLSRQVFGLLHNHLPQVIGQRLNSKMSTEFPTTLKEFGYAFNDAGQLRQIDEADGSITDKPFKFDVSDSASHNQAHYEAIGEAITEHVYQMLIDIGLHKIYVPSPETPTSSFVFGTKTDFSDTKKLLFLIHGTGVVRAGQWSRSLIINQSVDHGTQIPYIKRAIELGYDVLVTNTNLKYNIKDDECVEIKGSESPEAHIKTVWNELIEPAIDTIESFAIVAHSYGGVVAVSMPDLSPTEFKKKCFGVAFTDSVHYRSHIDKMFTWLKGVTRNYVKSKEPLNTELKYSDSDVPCFSAGHTKHEWTSWACIDALFPYLEEKYKQFLESQGEEKSNGDKKTESEKKDSKNDEKDSKEAGEESKEGEEKTIKKREEF